MKLVKIAESYVIELFKNLLEFEYQFHNLGHTQSVVNAAELLCKKELCTDFETENILIATWFHDTGYTICKDNHEVESCKFARQFLDEQNVGNERIEKIESLIMATIFNYVPKNKLEKIVCDADYNHLAKLEYFSICSNLRKEWKLGEVKEFSDLEWAKENLSLLQDKHKFYTEYAIENWNPLKQKNIDNLKEQIKILDNKEITEFVDPKKEKKKKKKKKKTKLGRGVETLFRVTINNHTRLSDIADSKANILLSVNGIIISVALSVLIPKLDSPGNAYLTWPTFVLLFFSVCCIVVAILATRPKVDNSDFSQDAIDERKVNLLFFGNFYKIPYPIYEEEINKMIIDEPYLYNSLTRDLHLLGIVLEKKYRLLRITYNIFMVGILISVFTFIYAFYNS
jgi:predicted metal-dependent HD superfamily phosphohydrolase